MKKLYVRIEGITPLLMNSPKAMLEADKQNIVQKTKKYDHKIEAEKVAYRTVKGTLYVPNTAIKGCMINASSFKKAGKYALKPIIAGGIRISPEEVEIKDAKNKVLKNYEIDLRTVVIHGNRVIKARPKLFPWKLDFTIDVNENLITNTQIIKEILKEGGERIGLLDFSPRNRGDFGCFKVTKFEEA